MTDSGFCSYMNPSRATIPLIRPHQCDSEGGRIRGVLLYNKLHGILHELPEKHFPNKEVRFNKYKHKKSTWITIGIMNLIKHKDK